mgnify:FL=1
MPTVAQIEQALFQLAPKDLAFDWDNVGHLEGSPDQEVQRVLVALDVTENVVSEAEKLGCQLIVSHHPLMNVRWHQAEMQTLRPDRYLGRLLRRLVKADISVISMHTNLDIAPGGVNDALAEALRIEDPGPMPGDETGLCRVGRLRNPVKLSDFAGEVCKALHANGVRYAGDRPVEYIAVGGGACGDYEDAAIAAGCDVFVTSDLSYHQFLDAAGKGIRLIDAGHFPTENPVCTVLAEYLRGRFPGLTVTKSASHREVIQYYVEGE